MKIFEFQFNPKAKKDRFLKVFSFESPAGEGKGTLSVVGDLRNALPHNPAFLEKVATTVQEEYYKAGSLKNALKKANALLAAEAKKDNVAWLGNLHIALVALVPGEKAYSVHFTKVGNMKLWMARNTSLVDMGKSIDAQKGEGGSARVFGAIGLGKVVPQDRVFVLTEELFDTFSKLNILQDLAQMREEKQFTELFKNKAKELSKVSGILYFLFIEPPSQLNETRAKPVRKMPTFQLPTFSKEQLLARPKLLVRENLKLLAAPKLSMPQIAIKVPAALDKKTRENMASFRGVPLVKKALGLLFVLAIILGIGFAILKGAPAGTSPEALAVLESARNLQAQAEQAFVSQDEQQANRLLQEAWAKLAPYTQLEEFASLQQEVEQRLNEINKVMVLGNLEPLVQIDTTELGGSPESMFTLDTTFYVFRAASSQLVSVEVSNGAQATFSAGRNLRYGGRFANTFVFFADPNLVVAFNESSGWSETRVSFPRDFIPQGMAIYASAMYVFDGSTAQIVRVVQGAGVPWIDPSSLKKPLDMTDIAIDGNIWVIKKGGEIQRYFKGSYQGSIEFPIFPALRDPKRLETTAQVSYLYILEPAEKRIVVFTKDGNLVAQYKSEAFENASDLVISANGQVAYVLADSAIYQVALF